MTIKVYESIMPGEPAEVYDDHGLTIEQFIQSITPKYRRNECQPVSCSMNGAIIKPLDWCDAWIAEKDILEIRPVPYGDALNFIFPFWAGTVNLAVTKAFSYLIPDLPGQPGAGNQGRQISPSDARANTARLGEAVPEGMGFYIRFPDYLSQPRRFYSNTSTQVLRLLLCVGVGSYDIDSDSVKIGETSINNLDDADFTIYAPGSDLSSDPNHENWYGVPEVGSTNSSAGIKMRGITYNQRTYFGSGTASGDTIIGITVGSLWEPNLIGSIKMTQNITVADGGGPGVADIFNGNFQHLVAGMTVTVESNSIPDANYTVASINGSKTQITLSFGGSPVDNAITGSRTMAIDKAGTEYRLVSIFGSFSIDVIRRLAGGAADPDWDGNLPATSLDLEIIWDADTFTASRSTPFIACPENETTDEVEVDIFAPVGLGIVDGESINTRSRTVRIEWRAVGDTVWNTQLETVSGNTRDQLGFTFTINLPSAIRPEVRVSRLGEEDVSVTSLDSLEFTAMRSKLTTVTSYPDITVMSVTITGSDQISSASNNRISLEATRKLPEISGGAFTAPVATSKISAAACYVAKSLGYTDDQLDLDEFERLETIWTARGDTFDYVFADGTAKDAIDTILRAGFAEMTIDRGVISPVRDEPRTVLEQGYSPENMTAPLRRQFTGKQPDEPDGVEVEYTKAGTWTTETVKCLLPGDQQIKLDKIKLNGVTDETRAWRIGMRRRRDQRYRRWIYTFDTELDALNSSYLSYVPLVDDIPGYGKVCILESISADRIVVSEPVTFEAGKTHVVAYRDENGDTVGPFTATQGADEFTILASIPQPWPAVLPGDREPTHVYFGTTERWNFPALITQISPSSPLEVGVTATNYDDRVYADDDNSPP